MCGFHIFIILLKTNLINLIFRDLEVTEYIYWRKVKQYETKKHKQLVFFDRTPITKRMQ